MEIWQEWWNMASALRDVCSRTQSFLWLVTALAGVCIRPDMLGVTSVVRALGLVNGCYDRLLDFFHSSAIDPDRLAKKWTELVLKHFPDIYRFNGRPVLLGDGLKVPRSGRKMPGVKLLHQQSQSNTKPEYIRGHSCQVVSLLVGAASSAFAVPLAARIHEGLVFSNRDTRTLMDKMLSLIELIGVKEPFYFVADAYYACKAIASGLLVDGNYLLSRVRNNAVAYIPALPATRRKRGRPLMYGKKIRLIEFLNDPAKMIEAKSPVYGEENVTLKYLSMDLFWKPLKRIVRFVLVIHPVRGMIVLMGTDLLLAPIEMIRLYGLRFKIELSFKQALRMLGVYAYHFWMKKMVPLKYLSGDQYLHHKTEKYRNAVRRKIAAYHRHIQIGLIAQGLLQYLAVRHPGTVWQSFGSWLRTIRPGIPPSELVVSSALRNTLPEFLAGSGNGSAFTKFILERIDLNRSEGLRLSG